MDRELKKHEIAGYLPHNLFGVFDVNSQILDIERVIYGAEIPLHGYNCGGTVAAFKPVLRPCSDMYRTVTHNGKEQIPIVECAKIYYSELKWNMHEKDMYAESGNWQFYYCNGFISFRKDTREYHPVENQYQLFDYLNELKIDYRGLIDAGIAVSVYDLEINPYK
jgi:hypothetical protein